MSFSDLVPSLMAAMPALRGRLIANQPLAEFTWFRVGGPAQVLFLPDDEDDLAYFCRQAPRDLPLTAVGVGSNLVVRDGGVPGVVVRLGRGFNRVRVEGRRITAGAAALDVQVAKAAQEAGLSGLAFLRGIPGTVGGALHGNAGSRGGDIGQWASQAVVMTRTGELITREREDMVFAYRQSSLDELAIVSARFELEPDDPTELTKRMQRQWIVKKAQQPLGHQNSGCIFKSPRGMSAGELIEQAGLKGAKVGGAEVSGRHANFIVAEPGASSNDVLRLIDLIRARVAERLGVELEQEIEVW